jgi:carbon monoxide dehydrogenase subunit G
MVVPLRYLIVLLTAAVALGSVPLAHAYAPQDASDIEVHVQKDGDWIRIEVDFVVDATPAQAWSVLTDYDHMEQIVSNVQESTIIKREGERLEVAQRGRAGVGPLSMKFENVREIVLKHQREIHSRMISGDMKSSEFTTRITPEGERTHVSNRGRYLPAVFVPPVIGPAFIEAETRKQFHELRTEMLRRKAAAVAAR